MLTNLNQYKNSFKFYTELRVQENRSFRVGLLNGSLVSNDQATESGVSSRVFKDGNWGFCSNAEINDLSINRVIGASSDNASFLNNRNPNKCGILLPEDIFNYDYFIFFTTLQINYLKKNVFLTRQKHL